MLLLFVQRLFCSFHTEHRCIQLDICDFWFKSINRHKNYVCVQKRTPSVCILLSITKLTFLSCTLPMSSGKAFKGSGPFASSLQGFQRDLPLTQVAVVFNLPSILSHRALFPESEGDPHPSPELHQPNCLLG